MSQSTPAASPPAPTPLERDLPHALYPLTAAPPPATPMLTSDRRAQVVVVGGGYTGLSTALHLAERGVDVVLLEAHEPGWGAAGRNGGQVNAGLKHEPIAVERALGPVYGPRLVGLASQAPQYLFDLVARHGIRCEAERGGTLRAAYHDSHVAALRESQRQWHDRGVQLTMLDAAAVAAATGTDRYVAALHDARGGAVNPLAFARGLAAVALRHGASIHGETRALRLERRGANWAVSTPRGTVLADRVVLATDGYSDDLWPGLRTSIVPVFSSIVATEPLPPAIARAVMPTRAVLYEVGAITAYYRRDAAGRLLMGGRGAQHAASSLREYRHLFRYAERLWPGLANVTWTHWWNGQFALTPDFYPRLHAPAPGVFIALGYSGRGVALATALGRELAAAADGTSLNDLPIPATLLQAIAFHRFWRVGVTAQVLLGRVRDRLGV
jgi:glycine/D-amino acid oxidase-like deaminating enzyme